VHHLWFNDTYYPNLGAKIKWNPAIKSEKDRLALIQGLINGKLDVVATDHAPHTLAEKNQSYFQSPSGGPLLQHSLVAMLELAKQGYLSLEQVVEKMCHNPAIAFQIAKRGFIRKGYFADLAVVDIESPWTVTPQNIVYKCGWSPFENIRFSSKITHTFINGKLVYHNGQYAHTENTPAMALTFNR